MNLQLSIEGGVDSRASQVQWNWELRSDAGPLLSGGMSGRLRAGIVLGLRLAEAEKRDLVAYLLAL